MQHIPQYGSCISLFLNGNSSLGFLAPNEWFEDDSYDTSLAMEEMLGKLEYYNRFNEDPFLFKPLMVENISKNVTQLYGEGFVLTDNGGISRSGFFIGGFVFNSSRFTCGDTCF